MSSFRRFWRAHGAKIELSVAVFLDFWLILGHFLMLGAPGNPFTAFLNGPILGLCVATVVQFAIGRKFYVFMFKEIFVWRRLGMNTLIGVSSLFAYAWSLYAAIDGWANPQNAMPHDQGFSYFFEIGTTIVTFMLIGQAVSAALRKRAARDMDAVTKIQVKRAQKYDPVAKTSFQVDCDSLRVGDHVLVGPRSPVPIDCEIVESASYFDESLLTGESAAVYKKPGSKLIGGTLNLANPVVCRVTVPPHETVVAGIIKRIAKLQSAQTRMQRMADQIAMWFVPAVLILGLVCFFVQWFFGYQIQRALGLDQSALLPHFANPNAPGAVTDNLKIAFYFAIAMIAISCPCALGLAIPLAVAVGVGHAGRRGIVFNNPDVFEKVKSINMVAFDKTGTLTQNYSEVREVYGDRKWFDAIYALVQNAFHPLSKTIAAYLTKEHQKNVALTQIAEIPQIGLKAQMGARTIQIASYAHFQRLNYRFADSIDQTALRNATNVCAAIDQSVVAAFVIEDVLRPDAAETIALLRRQKIRTAIVSGDNATIVAALAEKLRIDEYHANCTAFDKEDLITKMQDRNYRVAFAGDGINDLIALEAADLSINMSLVNQSAAAISDISVINQNLKNVYAAIVICKKTRKIIWFNFFWAFLYNLITIPLAFLGIVPTIIAVAIMGFSDLTVILNTLACRGIYFGRKRGDRE